MNSRHKNNKVNTVGLSSIPPCLLDFRLFAQYIIILQFHVFTHVQSPFHSLVFTIFPISHSLFYIFLFPIPHSTFSISGSPKLHVPHAPGQQCRGGQDVPGCHDGAVSEKCVERCENCQCCHNRLFLTCYQGNMI